MADILTLPDAADYLGHSDRRFFSNGYKRSSYRLGELSQLRRDGDRWTGAAAVDVDCPADWSLKGASAQRPHLSTVDVLVLAHRLASAAVASVFRLTEPELTDIAVENIVIRAGRTPQEDLTNVPIALSVKKVQTHPARVKVQCVIGTLKATLVLDRVPTGRETTDDARPMVVNMPPARYYADGFRSVSHSIENVTVDMGTLNADARIRLTGLGTVDFEAGLGARHRTAVPVVEAFVVVLQLTQILIYELDALRREDTDTLWMMKTTLSATASRGADSSGSAAAWASIASHELLHIEGTPWRVFDIDGGLGDVRMGAEFSHRLPTCTEQQREE